MSDGTGDASNGDPTDEGWTAVLDEGALAEAKPVRVAVGDAAVLVCRIGERLFALSDRCTHQGAPLSRGIVRSTGSTPTVTCPLHGSMFTLAEGRVLRGPAGAPLAVYDVRASGGRIEVRPRT